MRHLIVGLAVLVCAGSAEAQFARPNDRGISFGHVHLVVADLDLHKRLWPEIFGAQLIEKQGYTAVRVDDALIFFRDAEPTTASVDTAMDHFGLSVQDLDGVLSRWRALGYEVDSQTTDGTGKVVAYITIPGGVRLALQESTDESARTSMGHVHFATPKPGELMAWYAERFGATPLNQDDGGHLASVPGSLLRFEETAQARLPTEGTAIDHIGFEVEPWDAFIETLKQADIQFEFGPVYIDSLDLWVAFFNDPGGVLVEITHGLDQF